LAPDRLSPAQPRIFRWNPVPGYYWIGHPAAFFKDEEVDVAFLEASVVSEADGRSPSRYVLKLYVTGQTPNTERAITNLRRICAEELGGQYEMQVIDVLEHPQMAEDDKILATPTLIKRLPPPLRRVIGDLSDKHKVLLGLEVVADGGEHAAQPKQS
jgi:circadian clock protein KaiB